MADPELQTANYPAFLAELRGLGDTDAERAAQAGVDAAKTIERWRKRLPQPLRPFVRRPELLRALLQDLDRSAA